MNVGGIVKGVLGAAASVVGLGGNDRSVLTQAVEVLDRVRATPEGRATLLEHEEEMKRLAIEEMKAANTESLAMIASEDKFVSRARPTGLYLFYGCSVALVIAHVLGTEIDPTFVWSVLAPMAGTGGLYIWKRTREKMNGHGGTA